jgi:hypothetical protein
MAENKKLTQDELEQVQQLQQKNNAIVGELGQIELAKLSIDNQRKSVEAFIEEVRQEEKILAERLEKKYGKGSINLQQGEFIPAPDQSEAM